MKGRIFVTKIWLKFCLGMFAGFVIAMSTSWARESVPAEWFPGATLDVSILQIIDGDTIRVRRASSIVDVRLHGIDAPEWNQSCLTRTGEAFSCGKRATEALSAIIGAHPVACRSDRMHGLCVTGGLPVTCHVTDLDRKWGRPVAKCFAGRTDMGREMVSRGFAKAAYSEDYVSLAASARLTKKGFWAGSFGDPGAFRRGL